MPTKWQAGTFSGEAEALCRCPSTPSRYDTPHSSMKNAFPLLILLSAGLVHADVRLPSIFSDHLVLQRDKPVAVWGKADAGEAVTVTFGNQRKEATAGADGSWKVALDALKASAEPVELKVKGKNEVVLKDILVGEVWVCSGQSNMEWPVSKALHPDQEIPAANFPQIRLFTMPNAMADARKDDTGGQLAWQLCSPDTVKGFSAVGYFFGRELNKELQVPVGLVDTTWGGTPAEAWISSQALQGDTSGARLTAAWSRFLKTYDPAAAKAEHQKAKAEMVRVKTENAKPGATRQPVPASPRAFINHFTSASRPSVLFNAMVAPIIPYTVKGVVWYQGESNQRRAVQYQSLLPTLIADWRTQWSDDFSFHLVQLAGFGNNRNWPQPAGSEDPWAELQWAQLQTSLRVPKCGMAVANDLGEVKDIHPRNKQEVARRLALIALVEDYKKTDGQPNGINGGPIFDKVVVAGDKISISWSNVGGGLQARDGGELKGFIIAGEDRIWKSAKARVVGNEVHVSSEEVANPVAVRYAWASWCPEANLINKEGFPASLFRSDDWELSTQGVDVPQEIDALLNVPAVPSAATPTSSEAALKNSPEGLPPKAD